jgi:hypothetical protein
LLKPDKSSGSLGEIGITLSKNYQNLTRVVAVLGRLASLFPRITKRELTLYKRVLTLPLFGLKMWQKQKPFKLG